MWVSECVYVHTATVCLPSLQVVCNLSRSREPRRWKQTCLQPSVRWKDWKASRPIHFHIAAEVFFCFLLFTLWWRWQQQLPAALYKCFPNCEQHLALCLQPTLRLFANYGGILTWPVKLDEIIFINFYKITVFFSHFLSVWIHFNKEPNDFRAYFIAVF